MSQEKTEPPTHKKLEDARKKGEVAISKDAISLFVFVGVVGFLYLGSSTFIDAFTAILYAALSGQQNPQNLLSLGSDFILFISLGLAIVVFTSATLGAFLQVQFLIALEALQPKLERLNPVQGAKKLFSIKSLINLAKMLIVSALIGFSVYDALLQSINPVIHMIYQNPHDIKVVATLLMFNITMAALLIFFIQAAVDYGLQKHWFIKGQRMSKEDMKQEYKNAEGDPHIKGQRKQMHRELSENRMMEDVKKANVLVVNPEHYAVALIYTEGIHPLPVVIAKGEDALALQMRKVAEKAGVPVLRNVKLARSLHDTSQLYGYIPEDMMEPIAEVLKWAQRQKDKINE